MSVELGKVHDEISKAGAQSAGPEQTGQDTSQGPDQSGPEGDNIKDAEVK